MPATDAPPRPRTAVLLGLLVLGNLAAWGWALALFAGQPALLGTALLAWIFGLRHAVDADHIAAIDNVVRKLVQEGRPAQLVGLWFSLGHSTVVVLASLAVVAATSAAQGGLPMVAEVGGVIGPLVSGLFLLGIGLYNLVLLLRLLRGMQDRRSAPAATEAQGVPAHGLLARVFRPLFGGIRRGWHMYPLGLLFGLGFDTASAVGLLGISAAQAAQGLSPWQAPAQVMVFPVLFTAGMALVDTADSVLMTRAYAWAFVEPARKLRYNLAITAISVFVALGVGGAEVLGLIGEHLDLRGPLWEALEALDAPLGYAGFGITGLLALCFAVSLLLHRGRRDARLGAAGQG
ncbi:HoxN/HupN/NixA family nickel/cobalt transporter [Paracraurococcus ruber]|uniref:Nickel/cobalt efflux system n=1 Tax=Paracraurococcus ruber TaxID=77675 RepID=A0ABS1CSW9_9PROT|nr:HoxN/HupN/NixA family nickel/cobalt transporter [Paracraurococcus ruber]MBK1657460.1 hypothetical protein [Paracraurococcus ruber]TDG32976.1 HoxN/HupN/NixA family nickel/cobalt transporter [Paracraurococcus ruber]